MTVVPQTGAIGIVMIGVENLKVDVAGDIWLPGVTLDNIYIKRFSNNGLDLENCGEMTLETVWSQYNGNDGINIDGTITTLYFNNCKFDVNDRYGMYIKDLVSSDLGNTVIQSNVIGGLICDPDVQADINSNLMLNVHFEADDGTGEAYAQIIKGERWNIQLARTQSTNATKDFLFDIDYSTISLNMPAVTMDLTGDYNEVVATGTYNSVIGLVDSGTGNRILTQTSLGATATTPARDGTWIQGESLPLLGGATGHHAFTTATFVWDGVTGNQAFSNPDFPTDSGIVVPNDCYIVSASCKFDGGGALAGNALTVRFSTAENGDTNLTDDNSTVVMFSTSASTSRVSLDSSDLNTTLLDGRFRLSQGDTLCMRLNGDLGGNIFDVAVIVTLATKIGN